MQFNPLSIMLTGFIALPAVMATHKIGDPCTKKKYYNTLGCSSDECSVVKCVQVPNGGGQYYWAETGKCKGIQCQNGACNGAFPDGKCNPKQPPV